MAKNADKLSTLQRPAWAQKYAHNTQHDDFCHMENEIFVSSIEPHASGTHINRSSIVSLLFLFSLIARNLLLKLSDFSHGSFLFILLPNSVVFCVNQFMIA